MLTYMCFACSHKVIHLNFDFTKCKIPVPGNLRCIPRYISCISQHLPGVRLTPFQNEKNSIFIGAISLYRFDYISSAKCGHHDAHQNCRVCGKRLGRARSLHAHPQYVTAYLLREIEYTSKEYKNWRGVSDVRFLYIDMMC